MQSKCQKSLPTGVTAPGPDSFPSTESVVWVQDGGATKPEGTALRCSSSGDCNDSKAPHCWDKQCVAGFFRFDFKQGHFVIDLQAPLVACKDQSVCKKWQQCHLGFCRDSVGTQSEATGKVGEDGYFLSEFSYSEVSMRDKTEVIRIVMVGSFSDKLQKHLVIEFPSERFTLGNHTLDGAKISATLYDIQLEFSPPRRLPVARAVSGTLRVVRAGLTLGERVAGSAAFVMKSLSP